MAASPRFRLARYFGSRFYQYCLFNVYPLKGEETWLISENPPGSSTMTAPAVTAAILKSLPVLCLSMMWNVSALSIHADVFLVTGGVNIQNLPVVRKIYDQMPDPKVVVAVGTCACTGGIFKDCYNMIGGMDHAVPVDVYVPGCAARPEAIIDGVVKGLGILEEKRAEYKRLVARRKSAQRKEAT